MPIHGRSFVSPFRFAYWLKRLDPLVIDSVLTPMLPWTRLSQYEHLMVAVLNDDGVNVITVTIETSEDGVMPDAVNSYTLEIQPGQQASIDITNMARTFWRVSGVAAPGAANCRWSMSIVQRG